jgi:hypothetical protein
MIKKLIKGLFGRRYRIDYYWRYFLDKKAMVKALKIDLAKKQIQFPSKIAIIFIGTNKYIHFFPRYYTTLKRYFLPKTEKHFFVFTDQIDYSFLENKNDVIITPIKHEKFPFINLYKFKFINHAKKKLAKYTHIIYIDADVYASSLVTEKEFFSHDKPLFAVQHYNFVKKSGLNQFERNPRSLAAIRKGDDISTYWQACFWGGTSKEFLKATKLMEKQTDIDIKNKIIAKWWDESFLNKYLIDNKDKVHTCNPSYSYPEPKPIPKPFKKKLIHVDENPPDIGGGASIKSGVRKNKSKLWSG